MSELETLRQSVTAEEVEKTIAALQGQKVPLTSKVGRLKEPTKAQMRCLRCGHTWDALFDLTVDQERMCPACRNNGVRVMVREGTA
jgi:DNA-directed RNA polymerase subunit RPC12/RpoP